MITVTADVRIEYQFTKEELRDVYCQDLCLENDDKKFDFNGRNFNGRNFNGSDFNGRKISYYAFFVCYNNITCESWEKRRENALDPICLDGKLTIKKPEEEKVTIKISKSSLEALK